MEANAGISDEITIYRRVITRLFWKDNRYIYIIQPLSIPLQ
jgi:hypothetical protein